MTGEIKVKDVKINEDGGATYTFDLDDAATQIVHEEGLKLLLYCGLTKTDIQDVYDWILARSPYIREFDDEEKQRSKEREEANKSDSCVSCGTILPTPSKSAWCGFCLEEE